MNDKKCDEFEKSGWTVNPKTGRKIVPTGKTAKKLREECGFTDSPEKKKMRMTKEQCDSIRKSPGVNPVTRRTILPGGPTHKKLLRACEIESALRRVNGSNKSSGSPSPLFSPSPLVKKPSCTDKGFMQTTTTCWFNSVINAICMADATGAHMRRYLESLPKSVLSGFERSGHTETCPRMPGKSHVLKYAYRYYSGLDHLMTPSKRDRAMSAAIAVMNSPEQRSMKKASFRGFFPQRATGAVLGSFLPKDEFSIASWDNVNRSATKDTKIISFQEKKQGDVHYDLRDALKKRTKPKTLSAGNIKFELSSAVITISFERTNIAHAVALYRCGGQDYIYDSNGMMAIRFDWSNGLTKLSEKKLKMMYERKNGPIKKVAFSCEFFARV